MNGQTTVGQYLIARMEEIGLKHIFGIPGDYVLNFYDLMAGSSLNLIGTCSEQGAAFAADSYARVNGLGCICITYCVGGLNVVNAVAGAYAEKSPLIIISGAPGMSERAHSHLLHHMIKDFDSQYKIFKEVTVAAAQLEDPYSAPEQIDRVIEACMQHKRPVYIELPRDMVDQPCSSPKRALNYNLPKSDPKILNEALQEATQMLKTAKKPAILGCIEIHRLGLQEKFLKLLELTGYPFVSTLTGKSIVSENHPQHVGVYMGAIGQTEARKTVEESDCVLMLGAFMTDINMGTAELDVSHTINATSENISIKYHHYKNINLSDFIDGLIESFKSEKNQICVHTIDKPEPGKVEEGKAITANYFFNRMNTFISDNNVIVSDVGDSLLATADLIIPEGTGFLSPAYYTSMGFSVPAAIGVQINKRHLRPIVFVGDGAFQMTCQELSTIVRHGLNPIIFIVNNKGYITQRYIKDGYFNDIQEWAYHKWPEIINGGKGWEVRTEDELEKALFEAKDNTNELSIINIHIGKYDGSDALQRLCGYLKSRVTATSQTT